MHAVIVYSDNPVSYLFSAPTALRVRITVAEAMRTRFGLTGTAVIPAPIFLTAIKRVGGMNQCSVHFANGPGPLDDPGAVTHRDGEATRAHRGRAAC